MSFDLTDRTALVTGASRGIGRALALGLPRAGADLALEWGPGGVRVKALCPGWTKTDLNKDLWSNEELAAQMVASQGLQRWAGVEEMVGPTVFLASDASSYVTGQSLVVDGGQTAG